MERNRSKTHPQRFRQTKKFPSTHRHPWSFAYSPRRMAVMAENEIRGPQLCSGELVRGPKRRRVGGQ